jgi:hypothetical protein
MSEAKVANGLRKHLKAVFIPENPWLFLARKIHMPRNVRMLVR